MATQPENPQQARDEAVVKLLRHLFHGPFVEQEKIEPQRKGFIMPVYFFGWLDRNMNLMNGEEVCQQAGVDYEIWSFVREVVDSGCAVERLYQVWYAVTLGDRPQPQSELSAMNLVMLLTYADGTIMPVQVFVTREMLEGSGPGFNDGLIASIVAKNSQAFVNSIIEDGLDGLHAKGQNYRGNSPEDPFEVVMGLMLKHLIPQLRADVQKGATDYMRLFQGIVRPVLPPEIKQALEAKKRSWQKPGQVQGGWDV